MWCSLCNNYKNTQAYTDGNWNKRPSPTKEYEAKYSDSREFFPELKRTLKALCGRLLREQGDYLEPFWCRKTRLPDGGVLKGLGLCFWTVFPSYPVPFYTALQSSTGFHTKGLRSCPPAVWRRKRSPLWIRGSIFSISQTSWPLVFMQAGKLFFTISRERKLSAISFSSDLNSTKTDKCMSLNVQSYIRAFAFQFQLKIRNLHHMHSISIVKSEKLTCQLPDLNQIWNETSQGFKSCGWQSSRITVGPLSIALNTWKKCSRGTRQMANPV